MVEVINHGVYLCNGKIIDGSECEQKQQLSAMGVEPKGRECTIAYSILRSHNKADADGKMQIKFDSLISHDITYVGIIQTARASGLESFPIPYALTNCHNSLCAVGGTINEDDHVFGLSAAKKYGGIYVPANQAVIHQYAREMMTKCGNMILGSDSHTRYGALGTMGVGEGGPELVKQLLSNTWDVTPPQVVMVYLENAPKKGIGPHDVAIALCGRVFKEGLVTNKVLEFVGPGVENLSVDFRIGIDVMTTETACLSSIWQTDSKVKDYYITHGRPEGYKELKAADGAYYDMAIRIDLSKIESMIALPFHPSNAFTIHELQNNPALLKEVEDAAKAQFGSKVDFRLGDKVKDGRIYVDQGIIAGCSGGMFDSICEAASILDGKSVGDGYFSLSVYPSSVPVNLALLKNGVQQKLLEAGAVFKPCFCGPCFGAGDVPSNNGLSIRHTTRNFPNREGSKPGDGQLSSVALVDARSIAATALNGGALTAATDVDYEHKDYEYTFEKGVYDKRVYQGFGKPDSETELRFGPNITDWPKMYELEENLLLKLACVLHDDVTTTDELIPSGETSSYRSNPLRLSEFALSRREPMYVPRAKAVAAEEAKRRSGGSDEVVSVLSRVCDNAEQTAKTTQFGSCVFARRPGDGSAREQAASCQKVLGGFANICYEFATKRYRSNCINWGILPFTIDKDREFNYSDGDYVFVPGIREAIISGKEDIPAKVITGDRIEDIVLHVNSLTEDEKAIILEGCLMNYYKAQSLKSAVKLLPEGFTVTAHTGCMGTKDNSMESVIVGGANADIIEIDVRFISDGTPILSHDEPEDDDYITLSEAFEALSKMNGIKANVDLKGVENLGEIQALAEKWGVLDRIFYTGVGVDWVEAVKHDSPKIRYFLNYGMDEKQSGNSEYIDSIVKLVKDCKAIGLNIHFDGQSKALSEALHRENLLLSVWTVNEKDDVYKSVLAGPDNITTTKPDFVKSVIGR